MIAASNDPLFDDWDLSWLSDPNDQWSFLSSISAVRAESLVNDHAISAALVRAVVDGIHGANGLRLRSLYQQDDQPDTSDEELAKRRAIERIISGHRLWVDASGLKSREEMEEEATWMALVYGDGFGVRVWQAGRNGAPGATAWRSVVPWRVRNPSGKTNSADLRDGFAFSGGRIAGIHVAKDGPRGATAGTEFIPWTEPDGTPNVYHRTGYKRPTSVRGLTWFAPIMLPARMLQGIDVAYIVGKRVQASHPLFITVDDLKKARETYAGTKIANLLIAKGHGVQIPTWTFQGADYREFVDAQIRNLAAAWGIPWELVMGDHSAKSGASSRSLWQQHYQRMDSLQRLAVDQCTRKIDESILREAATDGRIALSGDWGANLAGRYIGPPRIMPDPLKEAQAATEWERIGVSRTTLHSESGREYRDETMQRKEERDFAAAQGVEGQSAGGGSDFDSAKRPTGDTPPSDKVKAE